MPPEKETLIWRGRPSFWNWWVQITVGDLLFLLAGALWWIGEGLFALGSLAGGVAFYAYAGVRRLGSLYILTSQRAVASEGLFSRRVDEVEICDVRNIALEQSLSQRMLGTGDVGISSAGGDDVEVLFAGIPDAKNVKERVRQARLELQRKAPEKTED